MDLLNKKDFYEFIPFNHVSINDNFFKQRIGINREKTIPYVYHMLDIGKRFDIYEPEKKEAVAQIYRPYWESEIAKWLEAASYSIMTNYDSELDSLIDKVIGQVVSVQEPDGYLNSYISVFFPEERWKNLFAYHELYNAGNLIEAAIAHFEATDKRTLLDPVCRYVDYMDTVFGPEEEKNKGYCGHPGIKLALVKLYHLTGNLKYLKLGWHFLIERGKTPNYFDQENLYEKEKRWILSLERYYNPSKRNIYEYNQSHKPIDQPI